MTTHRTNIRQHKIKSYEKHPVISWDTDQAQPHCLGNSSQGLRPSFVFSTGQRYLKGLPGCSGQAGSATPGLERVSFFF